MMIIRPLMASDADALLNLAHKAGVGFTSLPAEPHYISNKIAASRAAFNAEVDLTAEQSYVFVMEDTHTNTVVGICGIESSIGLSSPWYSYRIGTLVHSSRELKVHNSFPTLYLSNDQSACAEVCTLFLDPHYRHSKNGQLLSKSRFLFLAEFAHRFETKIIAEMRGVSDENGQSPFWDGLGAHFFDMPFADADHLTGLGKKEFIAQLMPRHPLYINLLPKTARDVIGEVHNSTLPARKMLEDEGFRYQGYVDIFDAGPTLETQVKDIRAVRESKNYTVQIKDNLPKSETLYLISNTLLGDYRCTMVYTNVPESGPLWISSELANNLHVTNLDTVRAVPLFSKRA
ncbi:MAG: arginine N-succinyltransferase [Oceanospirillaceae bacterium]|nr:arginine N-succinyltransferase [Oceanospirillaceae bacterium]